MVKEFDYNRPAVPSEERNNALTDHINQFIGIIFPELQMDLMI